MLPGQPHCRDGPSSPQPPTASDCRVPQPADQCPLLGSTAGGREQRLQESYGPCASSCKDFQLRENICRLVWKDVLKCSLCDGGLHMKTVNAHAQCWFVSSDAAGHMQQTWLGQPCTCARDNRSCARGANLARWAESWCWLSTRTALSITASLLLMAQPARPCTSSAVSACTSQSAADHEIATDTAGMGIFRSQYQHFNISTVTSINCHRTRPETALA